MRRLNERDGLVQPALERDDIRQGVPITVDLAGAGLGSIIGYRARKHAGLIDLRRLRHYAPADFWHVLRASEARALVLDPGEFYILASKQAVRVPADHAAEMLAYDTAMGEFRVHYAGFFDPGFGHVDAGGEGTRAVLEVRSHEVPFVLEDGQRVGRLVYERLIARPDRLYGEALGSSYQRQGLALSRQSLTLPVTVARSGAQAGADGSSPAGGQQLSRPDQRTSPAPPRRPRARRDCSLARLSVAIWSRDRPRSPASTATYQSTSPSSSFRASVGAWAKSPP